MTADCSCRLARTAADNLLHTGSNVSTAEYRSAAVTKRTARFTVLTAAMSKTLCQLFPTFRRLVAPSASEVRHPRSIPSGLRTVSA
jgi:hypothetical protein